MGFFDKGVDPADYEKFRAWVVDRIGNLEQRVTATASESAIEAQAALAVVKAKSSEVEALVKELSPAFEGIKNAMQQIQVDVEAVSASRADLLDEAKLLKGKSAKAIAIHQQLEIAEKSTQEIVDGIAGKLQQVNEFLVQAERIPVALDNLNKQLVDANSQSENIKSLLNHSLRRKNELDEVHKEVLGHNIEDSEGNVERVDGLRDELTKAYDGLSERLDSISDEIGKAVAKIELEQSKLRESQAEEFSGLLKSGNAELSEVSGQLKALMPGALAAGLSAAYEKKKDEESLSLSSHESSFKVAVMGLVAVSIIPFAIDVYLLAGGATLTTVLKDTPKLIVSILPLYFPVLWLAYSANKRLNLSKRLIEEYTHKAVLGKTFSGLSNQIETLPQESAVKEELRTRLLFNVLQVSAENPGKLITDYSKADHPLMDVLEKSAKLSESVDALSKIPGLSSLAKKLAGRRDALLREQEAKIEDGLLVGDKPLDKDDEPA